MDIKITTLSENTASRMGLLAEWGLSILVEVDGQRILLDCGQSTSAVYNAAEMGIDLSTIDKIVLSHGHSDHTGGLREVLKAMRKQTEIIAHPDIWQPKYVKRPGEDIYRYIGIPFQREELEGLGASFRLETGPVWLSANIVTTGEIAMQNDYEHIDADLYAGGKDAFVPDALADDMTLVVKTDRGLVAVAGCAHRGIVNTLHQAQKLTDMELIHTVIGGTHLVRAPEEQIELTIAELREMGLQRMGVSHCTGFRASVRLAEEFGNVFFLNNAGTRLAVD